MAISVNIPWLPSSEQFLRAIIAGGQAGIQAAEQRRPRFVSGGGGPSFDPLDQARAEAIRAKTEQEKADRVAQGEAFARNQQLIGMGVSPQEAFQETGLSRFGIDAPDKVPNPWQTLSLGSGEVARVNNLTGQLETLQKARPDDGNLRVSTIDPTGMSPEEASMARFFNPPRLSGSPSAISNFMTQATAPKTSSTGGIPTVTTPSEYSALKSGDQYYDQSGNLRRKK